MTSAADAGEVLLGHIEVNRLGFGAMRITGAGIWGEPRSASEAKAVLRKAVDLGVNFIDTAHAYGPEVSERLIAEALHPYPDGLVITTKSGQQRGGPDNWFPDGRPETLRRECERSLTLLRLEQIPLFQLHRPDPAVAIEESVGELRRLQEEGKIASIGVSNVDLEQFERCLAVAEIVSVQNRYSLYERSSENVLRACESRRIVFIPWSPLGGGEDAADGKVREIAARTGATSAQVIIAWLLARSALMLPIPGTASVDHLVENVAAAAIHLDSVDVAALDRAAFAP
ncbi:MAG TPA: aldo/keto reductase [Gemmatimonadaceae bacterium]|nr:aldo/keto reductase [Gemmatimonadaceae bacterium]